MPPCSIQEELGGGTDDVTELSERAKKMKWGEDVEKIFNKELKKLERLNQQSPDYSTQYSYLDQLLSLPWGTMSKDSFNLKRVEGSFDHMQHALSHHIEQLKEVTAQQERIESELRIAADLQTAMLPRQSNVLNQCPDVDVYAILAPAREVGGDLYNYAINGSSLSFIIADVSGKSVPAALIMAIVSRVFRSTAPHVTTPLAMAQALNKMACENNDACIFVSVMQGSPRASTASTPGRKLHVTPCSSK